MVTWDCFLELGCAYFFGYYFFICRGGHSYQRSQWGSLFSWKGQLCFENVMENLSSLWQSQETVVLTLRELIISCFSIKHLITNVLQLGGRIVSPAALEATLFYRKNIWDLWAKQNLKRLNSADGMMELI